MTIERSTTNYCLLQQTQISKKENNAQVSRTLAYRKLFETNKNTDIRDKNLEKRT